MSEISIYINNYTTIIKITDPENITLVYFNPKFITSLDDPINEKMSDAINLYIQTNKFSVIQFEDGTNWKPETGKAYRFRADIKHRVINASKQARVVLNLW